MKLLQKEFKDGIFWLKVEKKKIIWIIPVIQIYRGFRQYENFLWLSFPDNIMVVGKEKEELNKMASEIL